MTQQFTASEVRSAIGALEARDMEYEAGMLHAFADLLEAQEKAMPVAVVKNSDALYTGYLSWTGESVPPETKLYTHPPSPSDADWKNNVLAGDMKAIVDGDGNVLYVNKASFDQQVHKTDDALATVSALTADAEKLAEALRRTCRKMKTFSRTGALDGAVAVWVDEIESVLAAHCAQAQPPAARVTDAIARRMVAEYDAVLCGDPTATRTDGMRAALEAAQAQAQAAEPVRQFRVVPKGSVWTDVKDPEIWASVTAHPESYETRTLYNDPQPAQDASKYQELLMAVEKKFPGESRHETALRYIRETELQSCEPKCDATMAKESGNG